MSGRTRKVKRTAKGGPPALRMALPKASRLARWAPRVVFVAIAIMVITVMVLALLPPPQGP